MVIRFETKIAIGALLAAAVLVGVCIVSLLSMHNASVTSRWVAHTQEVLTEIQATLAALTDAESGMRGYLITGQPVYLQREQQNYSSVESSLDRLVKIANESPEQRERFTQLRAAAREKMDWTRQLYHAREEQGPQSALDMLLTGRGRALMDRAQAIAAEAETAERLLLEQRQQEARASAHRNQQMVLLAGTTDVLLVALAVWMIRREMTTRKRLEQALREDAERMGAVVKMQSRIAEKELESETALALVAEQARRLAGANGASIYLLEDKALVRRAGAGVMSSESTPGREKLARLTQDCLDRQTAILCDDLVPEMPEAPIHSLVLAPLRSDRGILGVMKVLSDQPHFFKHTDQQALELIAGFAATALDNVHAFEARQTLIDQLTLANDELEAFSFSVSHDLRAPLRHIRSFAHLLQEQTGASLDEKAAHYLERIEEAAAQMARLIDDLLSFARIGRASLKREPVDCEALVRSVIVTMQPELEGREVQWEIGPLPQVQADATLLRQVMINLLGNAVKYTRPRHPAVIETGARRDSGEMVFYVRDNGVGFDQAKASELFGVFQRLPRADEFEGVGIGLANVKRVVQKHGGRTWAEGAVDAGATFYFTLPLEA